MRRHPLQELMSRNGSVPLRVATDQIRRHLYDRRSARVLDPFCGKGTFLLAARLAGHHGYGMDVSPEAALCTRAQMVFSCSDPITNYISDLRTDANVTPDVPPEVSVYFHDATLRQLLSIRHQLLRDARSSDHATRVAATVTLTLLLGILHGRSSHSLSVPSAHSYAMSPSYVARYMRKHGLAAPRRDVKRCLLKKARSCLATPVKQDVSSRILCDTAELVQTRFADLEEQVDLIITSPPYFDAQTYAKDNWLRLWVLGHDYRTVRGRSLETGSISHYASAMVSILRQLLALLRPPGTLVIIAGDVRIRHRNGQTDRDSCLYDGVAKTGLLLRNLVNSLDAGWTARQTSKQQIDGVSRYYHSLNGTNGHSRRPLIERIVTVTPV